jgi:hypothetical protein
MTLAVSAQQVDTLSVSSPAIVFYVPTENEIVDDDESEIAEVLSDFYHYSHIIIELNKYSEKIDTLIVTAEKFIKIRQENKITHLDKSNFGHIVGMILIRNDKIEICEGVRTDVGMRQLINDFFEIEEENEP